MKTCYKCNVKINTNVTKCPLCNSNLEKVSKKETDNVYPAVSTLYEKHEMLIKIITLFAVFGSIVYILINYMVSKKIGWSFFVNLSVLAFSQTLVRGVRRRSHLMRFLFTEAMIILTFSLAWDYLNGWYRWSVTFVLPFLCIAYITIIFFARIFLKYRLREYIIYIYLNCLIGLIPIFFIIRESLTVTWPSYASVIFSVFSLIALAVFNRQQMQNEIKRRLHI